MFRIDLISFVRLYVINIKISNMNFDTEWNLQEFREEQKELFDNNGKRYKGVSLSNETAEAMLKIINDMEMEIKTLEEKNKKYKFMIENGLGFEDMINDITMPHEI